MPFDGLVVNALAEDLKEKVLNGKIDKIYQPEKDELMISIRNKSNTYKLLATANSSTARIHISDSYKKENPITPPMFCMLLRKHLVGGRIVGIGQFDFERILYIDVENYDELKIKRTKRLVVEIMGKHSNIILVDNKSNKIMDSIKRIPLSISTIRQVLPGKTYEFPPNQDKLNPLEEIGLNYFSDALSSKTGPVFKSIYSSFQGISPIIAKEIVYRSNIEIEKNVSSLESYEIERIWNSFTRLFSQIRKGIFYPCVFIDKHVDKLIDFSSVKITMYDEYSVDEYADMSETVDTYYFQKDSKDRTRQKSSDLRKNISTKLDRANKKLAKQKFEFLKSQEAGKYKHLGELITSYIYMIKPGMKSVKVVNFFSPENNEVEIPLKENLTPSENAQRYFKRYSKLKTASVELAKQIEISESEIEYLENILMHIDNSENPKDIEDIVEELVGEGYVKRNKKTKKNASRKKSEIELKHFTSSDGFIIYVGKNNKQNDYLTLKFASNEDLWLHTKDIPGSHVIIKRGDREISEIAIKEASFLAAYFSKGKYSSKVPVDYVERKYIKKPNGAKPGMVIYENNKTVYVTPTDEKFADIKKNSDSV